MEEDNVFNSLVAVYGIAMQYAGEINGKKQEMSAEDYNALCFAYEIMGIDTWQPYHILNFVIIKDPENIKEEFLKYYPVVKVTVYK